MSYGFKRFCRLPLRNFFLLLVSGFWFLGSLSVFAIVDENENGISDLWEIKYNGGVPFPETFDPLADPDADGWTNDQEAAAGTNPGDPNPPDGFIRPEIVHTPLVMGEENGQPVVAIPEAVTLTWPTIEGKQYTHPTFWREAGCPSAILSSAATSRSNTAFQLPMPTGISGASP